MSTLDKGGLDEAVSELDYTLVQDQTETGTTAAYDPNLLNEEDVLAGVVAEYTTFDRVLVVQNDSDGYLIGGFDRDKSTGDTQALPFIDVSVEQDDESSDTVLVLTESAESVAYENPPSFAEEGSTASLSATTNGACPSGLVHRCTNYSLSCLKGIAPGWLETACGVLPTPAQILCIATSLAGKASKCCTKYTCSPPNMY
ncbi:hypothetical protein [Actinomyces sp. MRS3W]|uniref:hypothetical protein n=1 Tax=Actinomyces sp. MRS3W TaxID=2800796 RepID=UPI0028FD4D3C|nr:hypothetical protein [Actinomyces sp. MRS3W]MDU0348177.1 hypothetical protein [Actinomyces sp. MRS3W]